MPMNVVILTSSDDEDENISKKAKNSENSRKKPQSSNKMDAKSVDMEKDVSARKRRSSSDSNESLRKKTKNSKPSTSGSVNSSQTKPSTIVDITATASTSTADKPTLVVTKKQQVNESTKAEELFAMFLSQCMTRERSKDMEKIVEKLKRLYEQMDPEYAASEDFSKLLNEKRDCLLREEGLLYTHIAEIKEEMKLAKKGKNPPKPAPNSPANGNQSDDQNPEDSEQAAKHNRKLLQLEDAMEKCEKRIAQLEAMEVDFDEEDNSVYLKEHRYKERAVELYQKWCELTGNHPDAGRSYLRPKYYKLTEIPAVDQAINSFINAKLSQSKKKRKNKAQNGAQNMVFPDYHDIYKLIHTYNVNKNYGMDAKAEKRAAKKAFTQLGEYLQKERQKDYFDTFSLLAENSKDPALINNELKSQLKENRKTGVVKLNNIFEEYCVKQEEMKKSGKDDPTEPDSHSTDESESEDDEEEEEDSEIVLSDAEIIQLDSPESSEKSKDENEDNKSEKTETSPKTVEKKSLDDTKEPSVNVETEKSSEITENPSIDSGIVVNSTPPSCESVKTTNDDHKTIENGEKTMEMAEEPVKMVENMSAVNLPTKTDNSSDKNNITEISKEVIHIDEPSKTIIRPLLKLKSFAKASEFWENSLEIKKTAEDEENEELVEIIELDSTEVMEKAPTAACPKRKTVSGRRVVILKNVPVPAHKIGKHRTVQPRLAPTVHAMKRLIPLSSVEIRRAQAGRPVAHIIGQRATQTLVQYSKNTDKHGAAVEIGGNRSENYVPLEITRKTAFSK